MAKTDTTHLLTRKRVLLVLVLLVALLGGHYWYSSTHPLSNRRYGFQFYNPTALPAGFSISDKRISLYSSDGKFLGISAEMKFSGVKNWIYTISESRDHSNGANRQIVTRLNNYNPDSPGYTCKQMRSPAGQSYRLCHSVDFGTVNVFWVDFTKDQTYVSTKFPAKLGRPITETQLNAFVDSFVKAKASGFKLNVGGL